MTRRRLLNGVILALFFLPGMARAAGPLVTAGWLKEHLRDPGLVILDIRGRLSNTTRADYLAAHIPGAVYSDYLSAGWRRTVEGVPGQLPPPEEIEALIGSLGIGNETHVVIVAGALSAIDMASATRVYWTFKVYGHDAVSILDGGFRAWLAAAPELIEAGAVERAPARFRARLRPALLADRAEVERALGEDVALVDNRPRPFFEGRVKLPFIEEAGTIPGAKNVPEGRLVGQDGHFAPRQTLEALHRNQGLESGPAITFCNTGHWASLGWFVQSEILGRTAVKLYDGSVADWALAGGSLQEGVAEP
jgi:thiosulfate/3-mercaptopyruvate sulfurtransferase